MTPRQAQLAGQRVSQHMRPYTSQGNLSPHQTVVPPASLAPKHEHNLDQRPWQRSHDPASYPTHYPTHPAHYEERGSPFKHDHHYEPHHHHHPAGYLPKPHHQTGFLPQPDYERQGFYQTQFDRETIEKPHPGQVGLIKAPQPFASEKERFAASKGF